MSERFIVTPVVDQQGRREYWLFEYDLARPLRPDAEDPRARYGVKGLVGIFRSRRDAELAVALGELQ